MFHQSRVRSCWNSRLGPEPFADDEVATGIGTGGGLVGQILENRR